MTREVLIEDRAARRQRIVDAAACSVLRINTPTQGDINFTVLVEMKIPGTPFLQGKEEIRSGACSLSKDLTDALFQLEANIDTWDKY